MRWKRVGILQGWDGRATVPGRRVACGTYFRHLKIAATEDGRPPS